MTEEKSYTPEPRPRTYQMLVLERVTTTEGKFRVGHLFHYTYKSLRHDEALRRAAKQLEFLGENPLGWKEVK